MVSLCIAATGQEPDLAGWYGEATRRTRGSQNTQPPGLRFRATLGGESEVELALV